MLPTLDNKNISSDVMLATLDNKNISSAVILPTLDNKNISSAFVNFTCPHKKRFFLQLFINPDETLNTNYFYIGECFVKCY